MLNFMFETQNGSVCAKAISGNVLTNVKGPSLSKKFNIFFDKNIVTDAVRGF